ncbi:MAG: 50S ribosomal protein L1, partial [Armatimonadota bacterium]|nr:50S ribosomal protein L1 [Armatimonadota bacterium]
AALLDAVVRARPAAVKGQYIRSIALSPTMGPSVRVDPARAAALAAGRAA